jgi:hypothetical protein
MNRTTAGIAFAAVSALASQSWADGFIQDSKVNLGLRNLYINQDTRNADAASQEEWGQGFHLQFTSGYTEGVVGFGVDALGLLGVKLDSGRGRHYNPDSSRFGGIVFPTDGDGRAVDEFSSLGVTGKVRFSDTELLLGTLRPKLPIATPSDARLVPQTFEGAQVTSRDFANLTLIAGKLEQVKDRNSSDSSGMSIAGANNPATGRFSNAFYYGGADYAVTKDLLLQYYYGNLENLYEQHFVGLKHSWSVGPGKIGTDLRYFGSRADGHNASAAGRALGWRSAGYWEPGDLDAGEVDSDTWAAYFTYAQAGHTVGLGYQKVDGDSDMPYFNQGNGTAPYLPTDLQINKFTSAGERSLIGSYAYDFAAAGVKGLVARVIYVSGDQIDSAYGERREWERNLRVDYTLQQGLLKGLVLTWRHATLRGTTGTTDRDEHRIILNYSVALR